MTSFHRMTIMSSTTVREMNNLEITVNTTMGEMLEYDMLYGDREAFEGKFPYERTDMTMGSRQIEITDALWEYHRLLVTGEHFTEFSKVVVGDQVLETVYVDPQHLVVPMEDPTALNENGFCVAQIGKDGGELSRTGEFRVEGE